MFFAQGAPWPLKVCIFTAATLRGYPLAGGEEAPVALAVRDAAACFVALVVLWVAIVLPSLCFSVKNRRETTAFVTQSALMLFAVGAYMAALYERDEDARLYGCVSLLVLSTHFLYMVARAVTHTRSLLHYSEGVAVAAAVLAVVEISVLVVRLPTFRMHGVAALAVLFAGEVLGLGVFVVDAVLLAVADGAERALAGQR